MRADAASPSAAWRSSSRVWTLDALLQAVERHQPAVLRHRCDQAGDQRARHVHRRRRSPSVDRLSGVLGPCNLKLGQVLASLSPFALYAAGRRFGTLGLVRGRGGAWAWWCCWPAARASWITYALVLLWSGWRLLGWKKLLACSPFGAIALVVLGAGLAAGARAPGAHHARAAARTSRASTPPCPGAARIWGAAMCMAREHPVNGVGARGFREAFAGLRSRARRSSPPGARARRCTRTRSCWRC